MRTYKQATASVKHGVPTNRAVQGGVGGRCCMLLLCRGQRSWACGCGSRHHGPASSSARVPAVRAAAPPHPPAVQHSSARNSMHLSSVCVPAVTLCTRMIFSKLWGVLVDLRPAVCLPSIAQPSMFHPSLAAPVPSTSVCYTGLVRPCCCKGVFDARCGPLPGG